MIAVIIQHIWRVLNGRKLEHLESVFGEWKVVESLMRVCLCAYILIYSLVISCLGFCNLLLSAFSS